MLKQISVVLTGSLLIAAAPASAVGKAPITIKLSGCKGCSITATWSKDGDVNSKTRSKTKTVRKGKVKFSVPKGYLVYFTGVSKDRSVSPDAATILVTQYVGLTAGSDVTLQQSMTLNQGAYYCMRSKRKKITAQAAVVQDGNYSLLSLWANPQLAALGPKATDGIEGVYGTQNTLPCN